MFQLINSALAQTTEKAGEIAAPITDVAKDAGANAMAAAGAAPQSMGDAFMMNMLLVVMVVTLFYFLVIRPQQRRMKDHTDMVTNLSKGERIVMQGGMIGTIAEKVSDAEVIIDCNGTKISVLRSAVMGKFDDIVRPAANQASAVAAKAMADASAKPQEETAGAGKKKGKTK